MSDIADIYPSRYAFLLQLQQLVHQKIAIENDETLAPEQKIEQIDALTITFNGNSRVHRHLFIHRHFFRCAGSSGGSVHAVCFQSCV